MNIEILKVKLRAKGLKATPKRLSILEAIVKLNKQVKMPDVYSWNHYQYQ